MLHLKYLSYNWKLILFDYFSPIHPQPPVASCSHKSNHFYEFICFGNKINLEHNVTA